MQTNAIQARNEADSEQFADVDEDDVRMAHYGHARYAANERAGVIWYDPRDLRERFSTGNSSDDLESVGDETITSIRIRGFRTATAGDPDARYVVEVNRSRKERHCEDNEFQETYVRPVSYRESDVHESLESAREWCRDHIEGYADAPRRDAVRTRLAATETQ